MEVVKAVGLWALLIVLLFGAVALYWKANIEKWEADRTYEYEFKQEEQASNLTWKYHWAKALGTLAGVAYFSSYLIAGRLLSLSWLALVFLAFFLFVLVAGDFLKEKSGIYIDTGTINSLGYLGYFCAALKKLGAFESPQDIVPSYAHTVQRVILELSEKNQSPDWFLTIVITLSLFLTGVFTLVFLSTALAHVAGARDYPGYLSAREAIRKWHRKHLNQIMHKDDFGKVSTALDAKNARKAKIRKFLRIFGAGSLAGTYFYLGAIFTKANISIGAVLTSWGLWTLMPQRQQEAVEGFITEKILKIQFQEWDSWASIIAGLMLIIGIFFAYSRVEKISPIFRSHNYGKAVEMLSELYAEYSNLLDIWGEYYEPELSLNLNDAYQAYLENISEGSNFIKVAGVCKFSQPFSSSLLRKDPRAEELLKILDSIDQKFEGMRNKTEVAVLRQFMVKHNLLFGYLDQYLLINGYSKFSEKFELPGAAQEKVTLEANRLVTIFSDPNQQEEKVRIETRSFIVRNEINILMTYLRMLEIERTVNAIGSMHRKSVKEKIAEAVSGK